MRRPLYALAALSAAFLIIATSAWAADYVPGRVIVKYRHGAPRVVRASVQRTTHTAYAARVPGGSHMLRLTGDQSVPATIAALKSNKNVEYAVPDYIAHASFIPNDPGLAGTTSGWQSTQWDMTGPFSMNAPQAWDDAIAISRAIRYAARRGAKVINMSLEFDTSVTASEIPEIVSAVRYAHHKNVVMVAASGNEADNAVAYPARTTHVIAVGAITKDGCQADYSNGGSTLKLVAPGGGMDAPNNDNPNDQANCHPGVDLPPIFQQTFSHDGGVRSFALRGSEYEGTSMASPHVTAAAALLIASKRLGPHPTANAVEQRLEETALDLGPVGFDTRYGFGEVQPAAALGPQP
jgi:subtilisin family serine protease